jgi:hypothetical protein
MVISSTEELDAFGAFIHALVGSSYAYAFFWISGSLVGSTWVDSNDGSTPLPSASLPSDTSSGGKCLLFNHTIDDNKNIIKSRDCSDPVDLFCEYPAGYVKPTTTTAAAGTTLSPCGE